MNAELIRKFSKWRRNRSMVNVTKAWIKTYVKKLSAFGGQITLDNFEEYVIPGKSVQTTLTFRGVSAVELGEHSQKFNILIPGVGWAEAWGYSDEMKKLEEGF